MSLPAKKMATYEDVLNAPENCIAEILYGTLYTFPRPAISHAWASSALATDLSGPFWRGHGGPGGWKFLFEPELHLGSHILVPDIAAWRAERMPDSLNVPFLTSSPDWICEVLSPSTSAIDRTDKMTIYAEQGVSFCWLVDPAIRIVEVYRLEMHKWVRIGTWKGQDRARMEPFDAVEFEIKDWWTDNSV